MLTFHRFALSLLLTMGPFRIACHAKVTEPKPAPAETCSAGADEEEADGDEGHSPTSRPCTMRQVSHLHAREGESPWETRTSASG